MTGTADRPATEDPGGMAAAPRSAMTVAVIAHRRKVLGDGLGQLRRRLAAEGIDEPLWYEINKGKKAAKQARKAMADGAELLLVWGGDGTVGHCLDELVGTMTPLAVLPAGTANSLAVNLGIPEDLDRAVDIALYGARRVIDVARIDGEPFVVMAGAGFDAEMIAAADQGLKQRIGRLAYIWTGIRALRAAERHTTVRVDGKRWFEAGASCVLLGNVGRMMGGVPVFRNARADDGLLHVGVITASGPWQWVRLVARLLVRRAEGSPFTRTTAGTDVDVRFDRKTRYELDGGDRSRTKHLHATIEPGALVVCVPPRP